MCEKKRIFVKCYQFNSFTVFSIFFPSSSCVIQSHKSRSTPQTLSPLGIVKHHKFEQVMVKKKGRWKNRLWNWSEAQKALANKKGSRGKIRYQKNTRRIKKGVGQLTLNIIIMPSQDHWQWREPAHNHRRLAERVEHPCCCSTDLFLATVCVCVYVCVSCWMWMRMHVSVS